MNNRPGPTINAGSRIYLTVLILTQLVCVLDGYALRAQEPAWTVAAAAATIAFVLFVVLAAAKLYQPQRESAHVKAEVSGLDFAPNVDTRTVVTLINGMPVPELVTTKRS